ncbi:hypothetical protein VNO77_23509 [Canavalia gladiata]|uniref:Uncharacterized protein n=1 Tax=Canavalia gladiata TaxID=3824 RepID=A0AAN9L9S8_CANGL
MIFLSEVHWLNYWVDKIFAIGLYSHNCWMLHSEDLEDCYFIFDLVNLDELQGYLFVIIPCYGSASLVRG